MTLKPCPIRDVALRSDGVVTFRGREVLTVGEADEAWRFDDGTLAVRVGDLVTVVDAEYVTMFAGPPNG